VATHLDARTGTALAIGGVLTAAALGIAFCETPHTATEAHRAAEAMLTHTPTPDDQWPPRAGDTEAELTATAIERIAASAAYDSGMDSGPGDGGPPIALPDGATPGMQARRGRWQDFHYLEVVLGEAPFDEPLPIVFVFHGRGGEAQLPGGPFLGLSHAIRVIVPQAPDRLGAGWEWLPVSIGSGLVDRLASSLFQVGARVAEMIRAITEERRGKGRPIVTGFSQGGLLAYVLALHHDDVVGHAFPLSTWLPPPLEPLYRRADLRYPPIRSMHGATDPVIPIAPTRDLVSRLRDRGFEIELVEFEGVGHDMSADMNALFHRWLERAVCDVMGDAECPAAEEPPAQGADPDAGPEPGAS
jgi:phospholipase/carboxylesterase